MKNIFLLTTLLFSVIVNAQDAALKQSIAYASSLRISGAMNVDTGKARASFEMERLSRVEDEKIQNALAGRGYAKVSEASISKKDGSIFVVGQKGQGSQLQLKLLVFNGQQVTELEVIQITNSSIFFRGGKIDLPSSKR